MAVRTERVYTIHHVDLPHRSYAAVVTKGYGLYRWGDEDISEKRLLQLIDDLNALISIE